MTAQSRPLEGTRQALRKRWPCSVCLPVSRASTVCGLLLPLCPLSEHFLSLTVPSTALASGIKKLTWTVSSRVGPLSGLVLLSPTFPSCFRREKADLLNLLSGQLAKEVLPRSAKGF